MTSYTVAIVTNCVAKMMTLCSPMVGQLFETMIAASSVQNLSAGNGFEQRHLENGKIVVNKAIF